MRRERNWPRHGGCSTTIRTQVRDRVEEALVHALMTETRP